MVYFKFTLSEKINYDKFKKAVEKATLVQPALHLSISQKVPQFYFLADPIIPINIYRGIDWIKHCENELSCGFNDPRKPLSRISIIENKESTVVIIFIHHIIADGVSGVRFCYDILKNYGFSGYKLPLGSLEEIPDIVGLSPKNIKRMPIPLLNQDTTGICVLPITQEMSVNLLQLAKLPSLSLSSILAAVSVSVISEGLPSNEAINCFFPVDLRRNNFNGLEHLAFATSWIDYFITCDAHDSYSDLAERIKTTLILCIKNTIHLNNVKKLNNHLSRENTEQVLEKNNRKYPTVVITGVENMNVFGDMPLAGFYLGANCQAYLANDQSFMLGYSVLNGELCLNMQYVKSLISNEVVLKWQQSILDRLVSISNSFVEPY